MNRTPDEVESRPGTPMSQPILTCPSSHDWEQFLLGRTPEDQAVLLEGHLTHCRPCLDRVASFDRPDGSRPPSHPAGKATEADELLANLKRRLDTRLLAERTR